MHLVLIWGTMKISLFIFGQLTLDDFQQVTEKCENRVLEEHKQNITSLLLKLVLKVLFKLLVNKLHNSIVVIFCFNLYTQRSN